MEANNIIILYSFENNVLISLKEIQCPNRFEWNSFEDFKKCFMLNSEKMKYFDDEGELVSVINHDDFVAFKELTMNNPFADDRVVVIAFSGSFDLARYGELGKVIELKLDDEFQNGHKEGKKIGSSNNSGSWQEANYDSSSSSSSNNSQSIKSKSSTERKKNPKAMERYAARVKKELNYLPGSEVADGQTIVKKWRIKNAGSKKWIENSVKAVLLPSEFSTWVSCSTIIVPPCFADQNVDIEVEITINGQWSSNESRVNERSKAMNLTWLLFKDNMGKRRNSSFKDYILTQLELYIMVIKKSQDTEYYQQGSKVVLDREVSHSSTEKVSDASQLYDCDKREKVTPASDSTGHYTADNILQLDSVILDLELPDCPGADDFQISDFFLPSFIPVESHDDSISQSRGTDHSIGSNNSGDVRLSKSDTDEQKARRASDAINIEQRANMSTDQDRSYVSTNTEETEMSFVLANEEDDSRPGASFVHVEKESSMPQDNENTSSSFVSHAPGFPISENVKEKSIVIEKDDKADSIDSTKPLFVKEDSEPVNEVNSIKGSDVGEPSLVINEEEIRPSLKESKRSISTNVEGESIFNNEKSSFHANDDEDDLELEQLRKFMSGEDNRSGEQRRMGSPQMDDRINKEGKTCVNDVTEIIKEPIRDADIINSNNIGRNYGPGYHEMETKHVPPPIGFKEDLEPSSAQVQIPVYVPSLVPDKVKNQVPGPIMGQSSPMGQLLPQWSGEVAPQGQIRPKVPGQVEFQGPNNVNPQNSGQINAQVLGKNVSPENVTAQVPGQIMPQVLGQVRPQVSGLVAGQVMTQARAQVPGQNQGVSSGQIRPQGPIQHQPQQYPGITGNPMIGTPYQPGYSYQTNYVPGVSSGWNYQAGTTTPYQQPNYTYRPNAPTNYRPGVPQNYQVPGLYPQIGIYNNAPGGPYGYPQSNNQSTRAPQPSAPSIDLQRHGMGHRR